MNESTGRIVVGVDGSVGGHAALRHALAEAGRRRAVAEVVTAYTDPDMRAGVLGGVPIGAPGAFPQVLRGLLRDHTTAVVEQVLAQLPGPRPPVTVRVAEGSAADVLLDGAAGADLLVVGTHRHGRLAGLLLGSVGRRCVLHAPCPVTVVHAPQPRSVTRHVRPRVGGGAVGGR
ncbi:universal stress protein [Pseudonocardia sp.]|uniref:universal stress protein n=1 Tax=Pseudonocardia sp. TaxID=60912 RepID=UPI00262FAFF9|nr:universal stress protein [Pseudonocardia sp.]MCW2721414.1 UspA domain protein [Pseudonocardia sp.]